VLLTPQERKSVLGSFIIQVSLNIIPTAQTLQYNSNCTDTSKFHLHSYDSYHVIISSFTAHV